MVWVNPSEERAGGSRGDDGDMHVYRSNEGAGWARLCVVADGGAGPRRADASLPPNQAAGFAKEIDWAIRTGERLTAWWGRDGTNELAGLPNSARVAYYSSSGRRVLEVQGRNNEVVIVSASDKVLLEIAATLREVSSGTAAAEHNDGMDGARRRTDDNLRGVFG